MPISYSRPNSRPINIGRQQHGFSLIEVLVAVLITATSLLGLAGLQVSSINTTSVASANSQSMMFISEMIDQLRSNISAAKNGDFDIGTLDGGVLKSFSDMGSTPNGDAAVIDKIKYYWFQNLNRSLPGAKTAIKCDSDGVCALKVQYTNMDRNRQSSATTSEQLISVRL